ncbi:bifunctional pyr operon transcriptional regulator/uracil phosphoribosyltransferase PyrR [Desulfobaculum bizertense]|uniref:Bifunctional protein PyrR n=1 Tax=Desulfobaculum bizertense DSM 18034 TaxID=1121442 RepID=A0A1T4VV38_9BACT|nr:bifunctional pyr operon transcriptional regulator/uracil phosphoribosyltransferase PyrR [Desulfobaculum bizertense]UIJ38470.1 bifunctional pyr operon transcriptional regulator/uracil phosphoribosyltransferase PyrR [Desulfobaculum bizertense]SKA68371.1 pyrimidine operon attenuation protein / uracil phosphoribosyltransferase [Desulfobaculum bizertense DSM 18034]
MTSKKKVVLNADEIGRTLERMAMEINERHGDCSKVAILGIQRRGVDLAARLRKALETRLNKEIPSGILDINLYRDDWTSLEVQPQINKTEILFDIDGKEIILVDDVLFTGRTIRAALEAILDFGRPRQVELMVLVDRGHRELPIQADYVGTTVETRRGEHVDVFLTERDGKEEVCLVD